MRPTRVYIDLNAIVANAKRIRKVVGGGALCAVIKADAYGHGAVPVAHALKAAGVAWLAVALVEEAVALRDAQVPGPLLVLGADYRDSFADVVRLGLVPMVGDAREIDGLARAAAGQERDVDVHLEIDTGMNRLGVRPENAIALARYIAAKPKVRLTGLMTHFSHADVLDGDISRKQTQAFETVWRAVEPLAPALRHRHIVSSGALTSAPFAPREVVRCGLALYGVEPVPQAPLGGLQPALTWTTRPVCVRPVTRGETVSYRGRFRAESDSVIATLPVGYADGYPRLASHRAQVLVRGRRVPMVGTICMDLIMIDVTAFAREGAPVTTEDEVVLIGQQQTETLSAHEVATWAETIPYEVVSGISARVPRAYRGNDAP